MTKQKPGANQTVLITGASSGIGEELAACFARDGFNLVLVARNEKHLQRIQSELEETHGIQVSIFPTDLTVEENVKKLLEYLRSQNMRIDHLVNNAGIGVYGKYTETTLESQLQLLDLNVRALMILSHEIGRQMVEHGGGKILNIASTAAFMPGPYMASYYASKAFVLSFGEALNSELEGTGVSVTTLCPGPTATGFEQAANGLADSGLFSNQIVSTARDVAKDGFFAMMDSKAVKISGFMNQLTVLSVKFSPGSMVVHMTKKIMQPRR